jgi:hypothetical protein
MCYLTSLRGPEGRLLDFGGLIQYVDMDSDSTITALWFRLGVIPMDARLLFQFSIQFWINA